MTYRYRGREGWPEDPATRDDRGIVQPPRGGAKTRAASRLERTEEYCKLRDKGVPPAEAGAQVGVKAKTIIRYEKAWKARRDGTP